MHAQNNAHVLCAIKEEQNTDGKTKAEYKDSS